MSEQIFNTRIVHKHDTEANWDKAVNFIHKKGELIVYDIDETYDYVRIKIGDGETVVGALDFIDDNLKAQLEKYVLKDELAVVKGAGTDSTCLHTGPVDALGKYQIVAGKYNIADPIAAYTTDLSFGYVSGSHANLNKHIKISNPIFDSAKGIFKAQVLDWAEGEYYTDNNNYEIGQKITFTTYYKQSSSSVREYYEYYIREHTSSLGKYAIIIGNGESEEQRSNAYALDWKGNGYYTGEVYVEEGKEQLAKLKNVPHYFLTETFSTVEPVTFSVKGSYLKYSTPYYPSEEAPFESIKLNEPYVVIIDDNEYMVTSNNYGRLSTVDSTSDLINEGDFIIGTLFSMTSDGGDTQLSLEINLPGTVEEQHTVIIRHISKVMVPEEIIPDTIARVSDIPSFENLATTNYVNNKIADLVNSAPETLDTLGELATAMEENESVVNALNQAIANKADNSTVTQLQQDVNEKAENSALNEHTSNTTVHITAVERTTWNAKMDADAELISIADIDTICGSVTPIAEVLF